ncbi:MAG: Ig-like domain-containing protein [Microbacterium sp.]|uniref:Ig-like domain-containing protein n=1 Tax=Microbacterium sp. TaxID=51671 RepID=UPI003F97E4EA
MAIRDRTRPAPQQGRRTRVITGVAATAVIGVLVTIAVTAQGYQVQEVPREDSYVWVMRDTGQYARVNTAIGEIDTVRSVDDPSALVQRGSATALFSQGLRQRWDVDAANPSDLLADAAAADGAPVVAESTPSGTREVIAAGDYIAYRTDTGQVYVSAPDAGSTTSVVDPFADVEVEDDEDAPVYAADAIGLSPDGTLAMYSAAEGAVRVFDVDDYRFTNEGDAVADAPTADASLTMTVVGDTWAMLLAADGTYWDARGADAAALDVGSDARLQSGSAEADTAYIADSDGLVSVALGSGDDERVTEATGMPAQPVVIGDDVAAAWIDQDAATLWADDHATPLDVPVGSLDQVPTIQPAFRLNGDAVVLTEVSTGLIWSVPDGDLIPLEQWDVEDDIEKEEGTIVVEDVAEQMPPVAVADAFGVRAGQQAVLPVLLNDHDPNKKDVLTVERDSVGSLSDDAFGDLSLADDGQTLVVDVRATSGQAVFTYAVTDGTDVSESVSVTLTVVDDATNSAPEWCGVDACQQTWPSPEMLPGGSAIVPVLSGWVDPEGDPFVLIDAFETDSSSPLSVVPTASGHMAIRHTDPNATDAALAVTVQVQDSRGEIAEKRIDVQITSAPTLLVAPVAVTARAGEEVKVAISDHTLGGSGSYRLVDAVQTSAAKDGLSISPNASTGEVAITAPAAGQYTVTYTVQDTATQAEQSAVIRITAVEGASALTMTPITAFVRDGEDTTIDVFRAVQNTSGQVLILASAESSTNDLVADVVGHEQLRLTGAVADGESGALGRVNVTVADGTGAAVSGAVTVFRASPSTATRPIAFPDTVTVRAGELTSIPVTANDVAPRGERMIVRADVAGSGEEDELAFAADNVLRYLAPSTPGTYRLSYAVGLEGNPGLYDTGSVVVTVLPKGTNRAPNPPMLTARALSGQSVNIEVPSSGMDPDGDGVVLVDVSQPGGRYGTASISATGESIVYRAPAGGVDSGQVSFTYTVRDPGGEEATGAVRVGVLNEDLDDISPIAYSDRVRVQVDATIPVTISPLGNDLDPGQGELELLSLTPNAPEGSALYDRLDALIDSATSLEDGRVILKAGSNVGTNSYYYTVGSARTSSTAQGLIVVTVVEGAVDDQPSLQDTILTVRDRADLDSRGVDVLTDKVSWPSGDISTLKLSLWNDAPGYRVEGTRIIGAIEDDGDLVAFRVDGTDEAGNAVVGYGFLRIPAFDAYRVQARTDVQAVSVDEDSQVDFDVGEMLDITADEKIEIDTASEFIVQRANASCAAAASGATATYSAGGDAPWSDSCLVPVRLTGQKTWSYVEVPVVVRPHEPQADLTPISRTIAPGATETIDLYDTMTSWEGGRQGDVAGLSYSAVYNGSAFTVTQSGRSLTVEARADAQPGSRETASVSLPVYGEPHSSVTLVVGAAPVDAPRGATFTGRCTVTDNGCSLTVVGLPGEYDPFEGKPGSGLRLESISTNARCDVATVKVADSTSVAVSWPSEAQTPGGQCAIPFVVSDAQGRNGTGTLNLDLQGYPQAPAGVTTADYGRASVTLEVPLGEAARAHPAVTSMRIMQDGSETNASCAASGGVYRCTVSGLVNGEPHAFTAIAVNAVGASVATSAHTSWAYTAPVVQSVEAVPVYRADGTTTSQGVAELSVGLPSDVASFRIEETGQTVERTGDVTTVDVVRPPGRQTLTVVPISQFQPPITGSENEGGSESTSVTVAGTGYFEPNNLQASAASNTSIAVTAGSIGSTANGSDQPVEVRYLAWQRGEPECRADRSGAFIEPNGAEKVSVDSVITDLREYRLYHVKACIWNGYGVSESGRATVFTFASVAAPTGDATYTVATTPTESNGYYEYAQTAGPSLTVDRDFKVVYSSNYGAAYEDWMLSYDQAPGSTLSAKACNKDYDGYCSNSTPVTAKTAPTIVNVRFGECPADLSSVFTVSPAAAGSYDGAATVVSEEDPNTYTVTITWTGAYAALDDISRQVTLCPANE